MKRISSFIILALLGASLTLAAADADSRPDRMEGKKKFIQALNLTDTQKKDLAKVRLETEKRGIELRAKAETSRLELRTLLMADAPDQAAIGRKMADVATCESELRMNKVDGWFAANKLLTPEQQKTWIKALRLGTARAAKRGGDNAGRMGARGAGRHMGRPDRTPAPAPESR